MFAKELETFQNTKILIVSGLP